VRRSLLINKRALSRLTLAAEKLAELRLSVVVTEYWDLRREVLAALASSTEKLPPRPCTYTANVEDPDPVPF
jgi:hypothetical protein